MRIRGVASSRSPLVRFAYWYSRRKVGKVTQPVTVYAHHRSLLVGYGGYEFWLDKSTKVELRIKELAALRAASVIGCPW